WPCSECSCQEGVFEGLVDSCVTCGHNMDAHGPHPDGPWTPNCDYLCKREKLVTSVLSHTRKYGVMVIRATPMVGKTALLQLLGYHIVHNERDFEPVFINWKPSDDRNGREYEEYLQDQKARWQVRNATIRPCNPTARPFYLIDEAQGSYEDIDFWTMLKNHHNTRSKPLFVLVCVYGAAGVSSTRDPNVESQAQRMHALQRVELRPSTSFSLCMLFQKEEVALMVNKFAIYNNYQLGSEITFTFASPMHRRVAYRRLFPGREPDAVVENLTLQQVCTNAIARFSPVALQNRQRSRSSKSWGIPEAAFQDELYSCLSLELHYLPILSQYSHTKDGRIDLFVSTRRWGIEILQCGSNTELAEHVARFAPGGAYHEWDIMDDYVILHFCPRSALENIKFQDERIHSNLFHVVIEPNEMSAEIYTHDKQLHTSWSLSEGRQRKNSDDFFGLNESLSDADSERMLAQDEPTERERAMMEAMKEREKEVK
ncbi:hypothetical protein K505DRAFT_196452, partial [Melanomma pulvis-pyrius CBS 109.77]